MRIITGKLKGLKLLSPEGLEIRPTTDRVKESLFNILCERLFEAKVLDLFSGSGNLGLEAFSRGAKEVVFVDDSKNSVSCLRKNIAKAKADSYVKIYINDAVKSMDLLLEQGYVFDIIFCDPPYDKGWGDLIVEGICQTGLLAKDGILVLEHSKSENLSYNERLDAFRVAKYGKTHLTFFRWGAKEETSEDSCLSGEL